MLTGGAGSDTFIFQDGDGRDSFVDFTTGGDSDVLQLSSKLFDTPMSAQDVIDMYGTTVDGVAALDFGDGDMIIFQNMTDLSGLAAHIEFI